MSAYTRVVAVGTVLAALVACAEVPPTPTPIKQVNSCTANEDCPTASGAQCVRTVGACLLCDPATGKCGSSVASLDVIYVMSFPTTAKSLLSGMTVAVTRRDLVACVDSSCSTLGACNCIDNRWRDWFVAASGTYQTVDVKTSQLLGMDLGSAATLPVRTIFRPLSPFAARTTTSLTTLATSVLMPLETIVADVATNTAGNLGPFGSQTLEFRGKVPRGAYMRVMQPLPPFDGNFPPVVDRVEVGSDIRLGALIGSPDIVVRPFTLQTAQDLTGWRTFMRDRRIGERITNVVTFHDPPSATGYAVKLFTMGYRDLSKEAVEIVVQPPEEPTAVPSLVKDAQAQFVSNQKIPFPTLVSAERVSGFVIGNPEGVPISATLLFRSVVDAGGNSRLEPVNNDLRFTRQAATDADGRFDVLLPPGQYDVAIAPGLETGFATTVRRLTIAKGSGGDGRGLTVQRLGTIQGVVRLGNAEPLVGATVRAVPSLEDATVSPDRPFPALSRPRETQTASDGSYMLTVDPGVYDVIVEPLKGSRFGIKRLLGFRVGDGTDPVNAPTALHVSPIEIGPPIDLGFSLIDLVPARAAVTGVVVRAFAIPPGKTLPVELAWGVTDAVGRVDLYVSVPAQGTTQGTTL